MFVPCQNFSLRKKKKIKTLLPHTMFDTRIQDHGEYDHIHGRNLFKDKDKMKLGQTDGIRSRNYWCSDQEELQLRAIQNEDTMGSDDSGFCSPPLWKNSPSPQRSSSSSQPLLTHHAYYTTTLSPNSRLQAITRGQRELMEMVRNLPESSYELSLKDLVEHHRMETQTSPLGENRHGVGLQHQRGEGVVRVKRQGSKGVRRSASFEIEKKGMFLKMGFPFSLQRKKRNKFAGNGSGKVSPKPDGIKANSGGERDWWKKFTGSTDSDSSRTSNNSGSSGSSGSTGSISSGNSNDSTRKNNRRILSSCWTIFQCRSSKYDD